MSTLIPFIAVAAAAAQMSTVTALKDNYNPGGGGGDRECRRSWLQSPDVHAISVAGRSRVKRSSEIEHM
jgi:hypothetical protein